MNSRNSVRTEFDDYNQHMFLLKLHCLVLIREAVREHVRRMQTREKERLDRQGYEKLPDDEFRVWDRVAAWPEE